MSVEPVVGAVDPSCIRGGTTCGVGSSGAVTPPVVVLDPPTRPPPPPPSVTPTSCQAACRWNEERNACECPIWGGWDMSSSIQCPYGYPVPRKVNGLWRCYAS